ncbi:hypothetical protein [Parafrankia sp. FMc2]|uniref:hypothetical protein n=1 Tax=Parafrankia sp. FMc2 TaxID=3233196 RepID=UPI0034D69AA9
MSETFLQPEAYGGVVVPDGAVVAVPRSATVRSSLSASGPVDDLGGPATDPGWDGTVSMPSQPDVPSHGLGVGQGVEKSVMPSGAEAALW